VLGVLLAAYLALAVGYNLVTPVGVSPDEVAHAEYIRYVATHHRCPVLPRRWSYAERAAYEAHQPPLYYLLAAPVWAAFGSGAEHGKLHMAHWRQQPRVWVLVGRDQLQGRAVRLLTTLIGAVGLLLIWMLAGVLYPDDPWLPLAATAMAAFLPMRLALAAAVSNDLLLETLFTASLLAMALMLQHGYTHRRALALGAAVGAAVLAKTTGLLLAPLALITLLLASRRATAGGAARKLDTALFVAGFLRTFGTALLLAGPWLLRNQLLYGDPLAARAFAEYFTPISHTPSAVMVQRGWTPVQFWSWILVPCTYGSFWGVFGPYAVWMAPRVYLALRIPTFLAPVGVFVRLARRPTDRRRRAIWLILALGLALVVIGYVRYNILIVQPQSRFLLAAMAPIALFATAGWLALVPRWGRPVATTGLVICMATLATYAVTRVILPYYR
jgi:hypothetical protein